ncbi:MAG: fibronectin type III domain-containing protein [Fimbriimonadales bacterium]|nr:fibronectin type III domain-containing protein [Fimbriimonadales bacterium]
MLATALVLSVAGPLLHQPDSAPLSDPSRPVSELRRDGFTLQWFTASACATRIQLREGGPQAVLWSKTPRPDPWMAAAVRTLEGPKGVRRFHRLEVRGLKPGTRYYYRIFDPGAEPTTQEKLWGASPPWRREHAVSTLAPKGRKTVIRIPIKVLLMPNVIDVSSGLRAGAPNPEPVTDEQLETAKREVRQAALFFWVNSGMRLWIDFQFFVDRRWQSWGPVPEGAADFYRGWPVCRSWAGVDYAPPGGGAFTFVDTRNVERVSLEPVEEEVPYAGQIEMAWPRRWNDDAKQWEFLGSGGGTYGPDDWPRGVPGRSQYFGGGDIAWLTCHEFHHQLEASSAFSLSWREDERIVFNHYAPRQRKTSPDGKVQENAWTTSGRHGEHWDGMAFWDRTLSDAQWLRTYFGETLTVADRDEDGFPDRDSRLPLDERRFGSRTDRKRSDGVLTDLQKAMLSHWIPNPLQSTWVKQGTQYRLPKPLQRDSDGDGLEDAADPAPLEPWPAFVWPLRSETDGDDSEWTDVPMAGELRLGGIRWTYRHAHDEAAYYGSMRLSGPWRRAYVTLDGEGKGVYSGEGVLGFVVQDGEAVTVGSHFEEPRGMVWKASRKGDDTVFEFRIPNRGEGPWFWTRGGREIGLVLYVADDQGRVFSVHEPYRPFYCLMLEPTGRPPMPSFGAPSDLGSTESARRLSPGSDGVEVGEGWRREGDAWVCDRQEEALLAIPIPPSTEFHLWARVQARQDAILGAFVSSTRTPSAGEDYVGFVGGYGNTVTRLRLFGEERGDSTTLLTPGWHTLQLSRANGSVWMLFDGKPILWSPDPNPSAKVDRLVVIGGYGGAQRVAEIRFQIRPNP